MKIAEEVKRNTDSIRYYGDKIRELARKQFQEDLDTYDMTTKTGERRLVLIASISSLITNIEFYCESIEYLANSASQQEPVRKEPNAISTTN